MIWVLEPRGSSRFGGKITNDPWEPWYDKCFGFVIRADSELEARLIASVSARDEQYEIDGINPWLSSDYSICVELAQEGEKEIIMMDVQSA